MPRDWDRWLETAAGPASPTEEADRDRTLERIRQAIRAAADIPASVDVYVKGSYANNTNVRRDSDVDIAVEWKDTVKIARTRDTLTMTAEELGYRPVAPDVTPRGFRERVEQAVATAFGGGVVDISGDKAIHVTRGGQSLDADVVPCFALDRYDSRTTTHRGHRIFSKDSGYASFVDNFPAQNKANGVEKNNSTGRRYKEIVRCLKRLEGELADEALIPREYPGYLIECLLYNVPDARFRSDRRFVALDQALVWLWEALSDDEGTANLVEVNHLKWLFQGHDDRIPANARHVVYQAWNRLQGNI